MLRQFCEPAVGVFNQALGQQQALVLALEFLVEVLQLLFLLLQGRFRLQDPLGDAQVRLQLGGIERFTEKSVRARLRLPVYPLFAPAQ